jgi:nucleoside-diphosphate-sugar epimerase
MRILVTGGSGLVGAHVAEIAVRHGHEVLLTDVRPLPEIFARRLRGIVFEPLDIVDASASARAAAGCAAIIHCAAVVGQERATSQPVLAVDVNVKGTSNLLEIARGSGARLIHLSTASLYGKRPDLQPLDETDPLRPSGIYDSSKQMVEILISAYHQKFGTDGASIRTGHVYGLGAAIGEFYLPRALRGEAISEPCGTDHPCDFTYVVDLAEALVAAATCARLAETAYNISGGVLHTRGELAEIVRKLVPGARIEIGPGIAPHLNLRGANRLERARRDFGYMPRFPLAEGMADWYKRLQEN